MVRLLFFLALGYLCPKFIPMLTKERIAEEFKLLQDDICGKLEAEDGGTFHEDLWSRPGGGGGRTRILTGNHIEKGGVNFSAVHGPMPEKISSKLGLPSLDFFATGVSIVLHPKNPNVPIIHMNVRYFEMDNGTWWFGGGIDLTPHYITPEVAREFHMKLKATCDKHNPSYYPEFKKWADDYFFIKHRKETRGIGGIFFDRLSGTEGETKESRFAYVLDVGNTFCPIYIPFLQNLKELPFTPKQKEWQSIRRGRYVEFNLVWDKGTKFGLDTDGRTESILMSLPANASWVYSHQTEAGSPEAYTLEHLKKGIDWLS